MAKTRVRPARQQPQSLLLYFSCDIAYPSPTLAKADDGGGAWRNPLVVLTTRSSWPACLACLAADRLPCFGRKFIDFDL